MTKTWTVIEKIIGSVLIIWGMFILYSVIVTVRNTINSGFTSSLKISYLQVFVQHHLNLFLSVAAVFGGVLLFFNDKKGWFLSIICAALYFVTFVRSSNANSKDNLQPYFEFYKSYTLMALLFIAIVILLIQRPFIKKYQPAKRDWLWITTITIILMIDKIFI